MDGWYYEAGSDRCGPFTLEQMKELVTAGAIRRQTRVWRPGSDETALTHAGEFLAELEVKPNHNGDLAYVLPVGRSGWAIAAGYVGLFSFIPLISYAGIVVSSVAAWHLRRNPKLRGWGRVITGFVISVPMSILYTWIFLFNH